MSVELRGANRPYFFSNYLAACFGTFGRGMYLSSFSCCSVDLYLP